ncbi:hypothetical protein [Fibrobacter sp. UWEL]|uniref:hypothetical protein n=1 Tax=Fibrobacter sp. UWEL TaxID=1896209 RepID=UPI0009236C04|nr:hypothetical protein [Fibrobacter sp. UWEL]SHK29912.1 hypothetical protein SAMN05720468_10127 [Fibrobacter sp. UWEL]
MHNILNLASNNTLFVTLLALTPAVFAGMFVGSDSIAAAAAVAVAYASVIVGEKVGD